nr:pyridoxal-phosphate dependent enzyme [Bacteroidota bacterium]
MPHKSLIDLKQNDRFNFELKALLSDEIEESGINLFMACEVTQHPYINGNKFYKLKYNIEEFFRTGAKTVLTFGGAYSNHIAATAAMCHEQHIESIGIIRGQELNAESNKTLSMAANHGMQLIFVNRAEYSRRNDVTYNNELKNRFENIYIIPEGGANVMGAKGSSEMVTMLEQKFDTYIIPVGTGTTLAGIANELLAQQKALGIMVHNGQKGVEDFLKQLQFQMMKNWGDKIIFSNDYTFGGYGKTTAELEKFCHAFYLKYTIKIEPVYTGKMMFAIFDLIKKGFFERGQKIVCFHTGGLQYLQ